MKSTKFSFSLLLQNAAQQDAKLPNLSHKIHAVVMYSNGLSDLHGLVSLVKTTHFLLLLDFGSDSSSVHSYTRQNK